MSQEIAAILDELAARFGTTGARLWEQLVRYEVATSVAETLIVTLAAITLLLISKWCAKKAKQDEEYFNEEGWKVIGVLSLVVGIIVAACALGAISYAVGALIAPEAATLRGLIPR
jgi:hypothetical protein